MSEDEKKDGGGFGTGVSFPEANLTGANISINQAGRDLAMGDVVQKQRSSIYKENIGALDNLKDLVKGIEGESGSTMSKELEVVGGAVEEIETAPEHKKKSLAQTALRSLETFWNTAKEIPGFVDKTKSVLENVDKIGASLAKTAGEIWTGTFF